MTLRWIASLAFGLIVSTAVPAAAQELGFGANGQADQEFEPQDGVREVIASFKLTASKGAISVASMTVEMAGSGDDSGITVHVLIDSNGNGLADDDERSAGSINAQRDDDTVTLDTTGNLVLGADESLSILLAYDFNQLSLNPGDTFSCSITDSTNDVRAGNTGLPLDSATLTLAGGDETLTFDANTAADRDVTDGESAAVPAAWHVAASAGDKLDLLTLIVEAVGTGDHTADIQRVMLVEDEDEDGQFDPGGIVGPGDPILAEGTFSDLGDGQIGITFDDRGNALITIDEKGVNLIIVFEFTNSLTNGDTFGVSAVTAVTNVGAATIVGLPTDSAVLTVNNPPVTTLTVTEANPSDDEFEPGSTDVLIGVFAIASNGGLGEITGFTFDGVGDARDDLDILAVRLINDINKNGLPDAGDVEIDELTFTEDGGSITFDLSASPLNIVDATSVQLLVVVDINTSVPDGVIFGMTLSSITTAELTTINGLPINTAAITIVTDDSGSGTGGGVGTGGGCAMGTNGTRNLPTAGWWLLLGLLAVCAGIRMRRV